MKRTLTGTFLAVMAGAALVAAQAQSPEPREGSSSQQPPASQAPTSSQSSSQASSKAGEQTVTYTGCLEAGSTPGTFVLTNVTTGSAATPTSRPTGSAAAGMAADTKFSLSGAPTGFNMSQHLNHKVEITGVVADKSGSTSMGAQSQAGQSQAGQSQAGQSQAGQSQAGQQRSAAASADANLKSITVRSAKMVSDRCSTF